MEIALGFIFISIITVLVVSTKINASSRKSGKLSDLWISENKIKENLLDTYSELQISDEEKSALINTKLENIHKNRLIFEYKDKYGNNLEGLEEYLSKKMSRYKKKKHRKDML